MSKRFGRNQRRRMRESIERLEVANEMAQELSKHLGKKLRFLEDQIYEATRIAGNMTVLFPAKSIQMDGKARDSIDLPIQQDVKAYVDMAVFDSVLQVQRLNVMLGAIDIDKLRCATHVKVKFGDERWGYALSDIAIISAPKDSLVKIITREFGHVMGTDLKNRLGARP